MIRGLMQTDIAGKNVHVIGLGALGTGRAVARAGTPGVATLGGPENDIRAVELACNTSMVSMRMTWKFASMYFKNSADAPAGPSMEAVNGITCDAL